MLVTTGLAAIADLFRRNPTAAAPAPHEMAHQSLADLASAALKPGPKTWLVARAVSLRAF